VETHVCVYQTAIDLLHAGYEVHLVADAVSSRTLANKEIAIQRMLQEGVKLTSTEMVLLEMTVKSGTDEFRAISKLIK
jgi:nicotinamidase-related amidase